MFQWRLKGICKIIFFVLVRPDEDTEIHNTNIIENKLLKKRIKIFVDLVSENFHSQTSGFVIPIGNVKKMLSILNQFCPTALFCFIIEEICYVLNNRSLIHFPVNFYSYKIIMIYVNI